MTVETSRSALMKRSFIGIAVVSQIGNWLTFLAVIVHAQLAYGAAASTVVFVAQTVPALIGARAISDRIPAHWVRSSWIGGQLLLALLTTVLAFTYGSFVILLGYVAVSMLLRAALNPLFMTLITDNVAEEQRAATMTGVGAAGSVAVVLSPALGGMLLTTIGPMYLFLIDALTFGVSAVWMVSAKPRAIAAHGQGGRNPWWQGLPSLRSLSTAPGLSDLRTWSVPVLMTWPAMLLVGALLNALEAPLSFDVLGFTEIEFGLALACFGAGGLIVLAVTLFSDRQLFGPRIAVTVYAVGLTMWVFIPGVGPLVGFFMAGVASAVLSGWIRASLDRWASVSRVDPKDLWGWATQTTLFVNLVSYGAAAALFAFGAPPYVLAAILLLAFVPLLLVVQATLREGR